MGDYNQVINRALHGPPSSPSNRKPAPKLIKSSSDQYFQGEPHTPEVVHGKKRPAPVSPGDTPQHEPPAQRARTDHSEGSSSGVPMDDLIVKVEEMVKMLKRVSGNKDLVSDPLLGCFVSAQTLLMACTAELISRSTTKAKRPLDHQRSEGSINYSSITDGAADGSGEKKKIKKSKSTN
ncbi:unnamed protein product [Citrullus colocynthis]|uniref:Uncharacterized protein n=1 Tax=Citrullus colocynthis TaxID=252529 RepID=A0ABP0Z3P7_9ROSI